MKVWVAVLSIIGGISGIIENAGRIGLPIPEFIKNAVTVLKGKGETK